MSKISFVPRDTVSVTPSDSDTLSGVFALYVGGAGDVALKRTSDSDAVTYASVGAGTYIVGEIYQVLSTGTTATNILAEKA